MLRHRIRKVLWLVSESSTYGVVDGNSGPVVDESQGSHSCNFDSANNGIPSVLNVRRCISQPEDTVGRYSMTTGSIGAGHVTPFY